MAVSPQVHLLSLGMKGDKRADTPHGEAAAGDGVVGSSSNRKTSMPVENSSADFQVLYPLR